MRATVAYGAIALIFAFTLLSPCAAAQTTSPVALEWSAPRGCPSRDYVLAATTRILGQSKGARQAVTARATVSHVVHERWQVSLTTRTGDTEGERTLEARSCQALADTVGLILALAASPETSPPVAPASPVLPVAPNDLPVVAPALPPVASGLPVGPAPASPPLASPSSSAPPEAVPTAATAVAAGVAPALPPTPTAIPSPSAAQQPTVAPPKAMMPSSPAPRDPQPAPAAEARHPLLAALSAAGSLGPLPSLAVGGEAAVGVRLWHLRGEIAASYWGAQTSTASLAAAATASSRFSLVAVDLRAGYVLSMWHLDLVPTLAAELELSQATSSNITKPQSPSATWLSLGGGGWVYWNLTREVAIRLGVEALVPLARPIFQINPGAQAISAFEPGAVGGKGTLGVEVHFL